MRNIKNSEEQTVVTDEMADAGYDAMRDPATNLPAPWIVLGTAFKVFEAMVKAAPQVSKPTLGKVPDGFVDDILTCASQFSVALKANDIDKIKGNSLWMNELILKGAAAAKQMPSVPEGYALVPLRMNRAMQEVVAQDEWEWADVLVAANSVTEQEYNEALK